MNKNYIILASVLFLNAISILLAFSQDRVMRDEISSQNTTASNWNEEAKSDPRMIPRYGYKPKTLGQISADKALIESYTKTGGSRRKGSELLLKLGFQYLFKNNLKSAMSRFNQAWLLDSTNSEVFRGFGAVYGQLGDNNAANKQYDLGLRSDPNNSLILADKAGIFMRNFNRSKNKAQLETAKDLLLKSYKINPKDEQSVMKLSVCCFLIGDCANAKKYHQECVELGGKTIRPDYTRDLQNKCK